MKIFENINFASFIVLSLWFMLDLIGIHGLVARDDPLSLAGLLAAGLLFLLIGSFLHWRYIDLLALLVLVAWGYFQYQAHWQYFLFGASADQIRRYNQFYSGMYFFFGQSSKRLLPDAYHTILGGLIGINIILVAINLAIRTKVGGNS